MLTIDVVLERHRSRTRDINNPTLSVHNRSIILPNGPVITLTSSFKFIVAEYAGKQTTRLIVGLLYHSLVPPCRSRILQTHNEFSIAGCTALREWAWRSKAPTIWETKILICSLSRISLVFADISISTKMTDSLSIATCAVYVVLFSPVLYLLVRHARFGLAGWLLLLIFCVIRIVGGALEISNTGTAAGIISSVGLSPLLLATNGILHEACV